MDHVDPTGPRVVVRPPTPARPLQRATTRTTRQLRPSRAHGLRCAAVKVTIEVEQEVVRGQYPIEFIHMRQVQWGEVMKLIGSDASMGGWTANCAAGMGWNDGHIWRTTLDLQPGQQLEFKARTGSCC